MTEFDYKAFNDMKVIIAENVELKRDIKELETYYKECLTPKDVKDWFNVYGDSESGYNIYIKEEKKEDILEFLGVEIKGEIK